MSEYENPIIRGFNPDPSITRVGEDYFLVTSSFEYYPGLPIYHSKDLLNWSLIGHAITRTSQLRIATPEPGGGLWAPTLRHREGVFYVLCASFDRYRPQDDDRVWPHGFYVKTTDVWNSASWSDPVYFDQIGFDHDIFWDDDGTAYVSSTYRKFPRTQTDPPNKLKDFAVHVSTVDFDTGRSTSKPVCVRSSSSGVAEGSHIFKRNGYYYLFTAEGGTESGHSEWVLRSSESPFGPWELGPNNPLWRNTTQDEVQNTGHADLVEDVHGNWWAVLLAVRPILSSNGSYQPSVFGRETFLIPVTWSEDGWPSFNQGKKITLQSTGHNIGSVQNIAAKNWQDDFSGEDLRIGWYRKNTPSLKDFQLVNGTLRIYGSAYSLSSPASPSMFLRKQVSLDGIWSTRLSFDPTSPHYEAGVCVYWNYRTYASIGVRSPGEGESLKGQREIKFTTTYPNSSNKSQALRTTSTKLHDSDTDILLLIQCSSAGYRFGFKSIKENEDEEHRNGNANHLKDITFLKSGFIETLHMTADPPIGAAFTGMMLGLYAFGDDQKCLDPADFHWVRFAVD